MVIELWYDAVAQETDIQINEVPVEKNDIYGFLYPVRNYPIQSWLLPGDSWRGLEYQIVDLARGETVELVFHGRACDYADVAKCLAHNPAIQLRFVQWDICSRYNELFSNLLDAIHENNALMQARIHTLALDLWAPYYVDETLPAEDWLWQIRSDADFAAAEDAQDKRCCIVHEEYFTSYDKLQELLTLTRSLLLPADAVVCCFRTAQRREEYQYYAGSFKRLGFRFAMADDGYLADAREKYGLPAVVKQKIEKSRELSGLLAKAYTTTKDATQAEFGRLKRNIVNHTPDEAQRYQQIKQLRSHAETLKYGMERISQYIDKLLSVTKDNKDEVFHYECIDKLDETIRLYLDPQCFCEVN